MAGLFDDLIPAAPAESSSPQASSGLFDDLIPGSAPSSLLGTVTVPVAELDAATSRTGGKGLDRLIGASTGAADPARAYELRKAEQEANAAEIARLSQVDTDLRQAPVTEFIQEDPLTKMLREQREGEARRTGRPVPVSPNEIAADPIQQAEMVRQREIARAGSSFDAAQKEQRKLITTQPQTQDGVRNAAESAAAGIVGIPAGMADAGLIVAKEIANTPEAKARIDSMVRDVQQWTNSIARPDAARTDEFGSQLAQGVGSTGGFFLAGALGQALGLGATATTMIAGALPQASQLYREAEAKGATETQKWLAFAGGLGLGATEALPIANAMERWAAQVPGFRNVIRQGAVGGAEESAQEFGQSVGGNAIARSTFDPNRSLTEGTLEATAVGGLSGAGFGVAGSAATNLLRQEQAGEQGLRELPPPDTTGLPDIPGAPPAQPVPGRPDLPAGAMPADDFIGADPEAPPPGRESTRDQLEGLLNDPRSADEIRADIATQKDAAERRADRFTAGLEAAGIAAPVGADAAAPQTPLQQAEQIVREAGKGSTSLIQRKLGLGYNDAARLVEQLEAAGIVSAPDQAGKRTILPSIEAQTGEPDAPISIREPEDVNRGAENFVIQPTKQDIDAGKTVKRRVEWNGFQIDVETEQGEERVGVSPDGIAWSAVAPAPYGEIKNTKGADGDPIDIVLGPNPKGATFVVDQIDPKTGKFDEHKVYAGFDSEQQAQQTYEASFSDGSGKTRIGAVNPVSVAQLRQWAANRKTDKPFSYQPPIRAGLTAQQFSDLNRFIMEPGQSLNPAKLAPKIDADPEAVRAVMQRLAAAGTIDMTPAGRFSRPNKLEMLNILQFVASRGGVNPRAARELQDLDRVFLPRFGRVVRLNGLSWDELQEQAAEAGYQFATDGSGGMDVNELIEQMRQTIAGQPVYARGDQLRVLEKQDEREQAQRGDDDGGEGYRQAVRAAAAELDIKLNPDAIDDVAKQMAGQNISAAEAIEYWVEEESRLAIADINERAQERNDDEFSLPPYDEPGEAEGGSLPAESLDEGSGSGQGQPAAPAPTGERAGEDRGQEAAVEPGAEGKPQTVIPGAERIGQKQQAERAADKPLRPTKPQREAGGMFDEAQTAPQLFDDVPAAVAKMEAEVDAIERGIEPPKSAGLATIKAKREALANATAPEHVQGVDDRELGQIVAEFNSAQQSMAQDGEAITHLFDPPKKNEIVRLDTKAKANGMMTREQARARIAEWKAHAQAQGDNDAIRSENSQKVVLSLFDYTGEWSKPWEEAGYQVYRFDIQNDPEVGDVNNFSTEFFSDWFGDFDGMDIYAILGACPCTDFASSGARHFAAKDEDGRTVASVKLVHQTLATIEYFKPSIWAIENPVGRIEKLGGLPPWRLSFDPNHLGDSYTKKTLIWGRFNADLPVAPVEATEGSKMWSQYGGKSQRTKNARSATPEGFSYGFFMANNAHDHQAMALANKFDRLDGKLIEQAIKVGVKPDAITNAVEDFYYMDLDDEAANKAIRDLMPGKPTPAQTRREALETSAPPVEDDRERQRRENVAKLDAIAQEGENKAAPSKGASNTVFTADKAAAARARLKAKLSGSQLNSGIDPETVQDGITLAGFHIEAGARKWADYTKAMIADLGEVVRPYLRGWYEAIRYYPGFDAQGMSTAAEIDAAGSNTATAETPTITARAPAEAPAESKPDQKAEKAENPVAPVSGVATSGKPEDKFRSIQIIRSGELPSWAYDGLNPEAFSDLADKMSVEELREASTTLTKMMLGGLGKIADPSRPISDSMPLIAVMQSERDAYRDEADRRDPPNLAASNKPAFADPLDEMRARGAKAFARGEPRIPPSELFNKKGAKEAEAWMAGYDRAMDGDATGGVSQPQLTAPPKAKTGESSMVEDIADAFRLAFSEGKGFQTILQARKHAEKVTRAPIQPGTEMAKIADEAIELGVVMRARDIVDEGRRDGSSEKAIYDQLVKLYEMQPNLSVRTSTSMRDQAYSTPVPLAYIASRLAGITPQTTVYEPTAGNGALLIEAAPAKSVTNELNPDRRAALELQGFKPMSLDASAGSTGKQAREANGGKTFDVIIENPPFGVVRDDDGKSQTYKIDDRYSTNEIDHAIVMRSLTSMKGDGRAVLIIGGVNKLMKTREARSDAYNGKAKREFFLTLYGQYNVIDHFTVDGDLYAKQGAGYPVDVIVINGRGRSARKVPAADVPRIITSWADLRNQLDVAKTTGPAIGEADRPAVGSQPGRAGGIAGADGGRVGGSRPDTAGVGGAAARPAEPAVGGSPDRGGKRPADGPAQLQPQSGAAARPESADAAGVQRRPQVAEQSQASLFEDDTAAETQPALDAPDKPKPRQAPAAATPAAVDMSKPQVPYRPRSDAKGMDTLVPVNMQTSAQEALDDLEKQVGDIDEYVTRELGYSSVADMKRYLAAEQVDGVALGIYNFTKNAGLIIGDQTGIGKGRQVASILRWAIKNGKTPIFVTEKPNLYADMYRDLTDIGIEAMLGRPIKMFMTNSGESVPLDEDGKNTLKSPPAGPHQISMRRMAQSGDLEGHDIIFTTYAQMQTVKGEETERQKFLRAMAAKNGVIVVDEAHNAGGGGPAAREKVNDKGVVIINRATFVREILGLADAALYSSATYAKRPDVMDLYFKTDMSQAVDDISTLGDLITKGGIPMQQIVAAMLSRAGQYVRRERSFEGIVYDTPAVEVDTDKYEEFSRNIALIQSFSENFVKAAAGNIDQRLKEDGKQITPDGSTGGAGASSTNFTAVMHNVINQLLLSMKAQAAADRAIAALKRGKKPVITLANTNEAFIDEYAEQVGANVGDAIGIRFNDVLQRYLDRSRTVTIKKPFAKKGESERIYLSDDDLGPAGVAAYKEAKAAIAAADYDGLAVSPIDWIRAQITRAGYTVSEITGRGLTLDYRADGQSVLKMRPGSEKSITGRRSAISGFNSGKIDVLIINQSGSTGLSLHASEKVLNKNKRVMILAQAEGNIDTHMQMLGRVNRTGQVVLPDYQQLVAGIPAEKRPASILAKKMASLNANTTGARDSAVTAKDTPDFMNAYGDRVAASIMIENPDINRRLGEPISLDEEADTDGAMRKVTGRIPLLPLKEQEELYDLLQSEYEALIRQLEASGQNALEAKTLELDARTVEAATVKPGKGTASPFADAVYFEKVDAKRLGKPMTPAQIFDTILTKFEMDDRTEIDNKPSDEARLALLAALGRGIMKDKAGQARSAFATFKRQTVEAVKKDDAKRQMQVKLDDVQKRWEAIIDIVSPGQGVVLKTNEGNFYGIVTDVSFSGRAKNPLAMSAWRVDVALADPARSMNVPFSQLYTARTAPEKGGDFQIEIAPVNSIGSMPLLRAFEDMQAERREDRVMVTGNILAGFDFVNGAGQIVNFTDNEGRLRQGIFMRRGFDAEKFLAKKAVVLKTARQVLTYLERVKKTIVQSSDKLVAIRMSDQGDVIITTDATRQGGGRYFLSKKVTDAAGKDFVKVSSQMRMGLYPNRALDTIDQIIALGASFEASDNVDVAREIAGKDDRAFSIKVTTNKTKTPSSSNVEADPIDRFTADIDRLEGSLRRRLDRLGLADVGLRLVKELRFNFEGQSFPASGMYLRGLITVALDADNQQILDHEALHALKRLGAFTEQEWRILSNRSKADWMARWNIPQAYAAFPEWAQVEEGVAHAYEAWAKDRYKVSGALQRIFQRIKNILEALRNGLTGLGFKSVDGIFRDIERGVVGKRLVRERGDPGVPSNDGELFRKSIMQTMERPTGGEAAFALQRDPRTAAERQRVMQGFIARGQPLDRAIRMPFDWVGGVDAEGRWNPGRWFFDQTSRIVTTAKFDPNGRMSWLNGPMEIARAGLIDRHGQDPEYVQRERKRANDERAILMEGVEVLKTLADAKIGMAEAKVLQAILTGEPVTDADMGRLAEPIRVAIDELGQEAVALGLLSPESYQRNRGAYLTRAYQRYEQEQNGLVSLTNKIMGSRRKKIIGNQFKGRGMFVDVDVTRLLRDDPEFQTAARGKPVNGERFKVYQYVTENVDIDGEVTEKVTRRVYWPADRAIPSKLAGPGWRAEGTWEVRGVSGDKITIWRDYTKEERAKMGEILDARYTIGKTYLAMAHDLATGRFYKDISENEEWTKSVEPDQKWVDGAKARQLWADPEVQWVKVPMTTIGNSGGKLQWGALAGRYVRAEIWRDINELQTMQTPNFWRTLLTQWKLNKTARSPVTHMNNVVSNFMFADLADIRLQDIKAGIQSYMNKDQNYREALDNGAFGGDMMSVEVRDKVLKPLLDEIEAQGATANTPAGRAKFFTRMAELIWSSWKTFDGAMLDAYRVEDELFRMATYMRRRQLGDTAADAANFAREQFLDYDIRAPWVRLARNTVLPFISYTYRAAPLIARAVAHRPWKLAKYFAVAYALNALAYAMDDESDEERERGSLRKDEQGWSWIGVPHMVRMPFRDKDGMPTFLDVRRFIPAGDIFDMGKGSSAIDIPAPIMLGGPLMLGAELFLNRQSFTGKDITNSLTDSWMDKGAKVGDWAFKAWMPNALWIPNSWSNARMMNAWNGATEADGRSYSMPLALAASVGIKLKPQDVDQGYFWQFFELKKAQQALRAEARSFGRQLERNIISQAQYERSVERIVSKLGELSARGEALAKRQGSGSAGDDTDTDDE
jgi:hypothetical protein